MPFVLVGCGGKEEPETEQLKAAPQVAVQKQEAPEKEIERKLWFQKPP